MEQNEPDSLQHDSIECRLANLHDALLLSQFALLTFLETYAAVNRAEDIDCYRADNFGLAHQRAKLTNPAIDTLLCHAGAELAGYAELRAAAVPECVGGSNMLEIRRFYVDRPWHGTRVAPVLMEAVLSKARESGADGLWLGVWEHSPRAQAFYRKSGFTRVGQHDFRLGLALQTDLILERAL